MLQMIHFLSKRVLLVFLFALAGCQPSTPTQSQSSDASVPVTLAKVLEVQRDRTIPVVGTLFAKDEATLSAEVEGKLEKTMVEFGDRIQADQELALIDTSTYEAELLRAEANVNRANSVTANAEAQLRRVQALAVEKIAAASDLDQTRAAFEEARAGVKAAEAGRVIAKLNLEKSKVRAPFDAAVSDRIGSAGDYVRIGSPLFRIVNDRVLKFIVQVPERHASQIQKGQPISFTVDAWPNERFTGSVFLISPSVNTATRAFALGALVENKEGRLKANTFARGELSVEKNATVLAVPLEAVLQASGISRVFVVQSGIAKARTVQVGMIAKGLQEILAGLSTNEEVIISGHMRLVDGTRVRNKAASTAPNSPSKTGPTGG